MCACVWGRCVPVVTTIYITVLHAKDHCVGKDTSRQTGGAQAGRVLHEVTATEAQRESR